MSDLNDSQSAQTVKIVGSDLSSNETYPVNVDSSGALTIVGTVTTTPASNTVVTGTITAADAVLGSPGGRGILLSGTPTANSYVGAAVPSDCSTFYIQVTGYGTSIIDATYTDLYFEASLDSTNGINGKWISIEAEKVGDISNQIITHAQRDGLFRGICAGFTYVRIRCTRYLAQISGGGNPLVVPAIQITVTKGQVGKISSGLKSYSFMSTTLPWTPPATPTDMWQISGPNVSVIQKTPMRIVRVLKIVLNATQTTAGTNTFYLYKRTAANTGTSFNANGTPSPMDTTHSTLSNVQIGSYSANPSALGATAAGSGVPTSYMRLFTPAPATVFPQPLYTWDFTIPGFTPPILRTTNDILTIGFNGAALPAGLTLNVNVYWIEEEIF